MRLVFMLLFFLGLSSCQLHRQWLNTPLSNGEQATRPFAAFLETDKPVVLFFLDDECPICQKYTKNIRELKAQYAQIQCIGVFSRWHTFEKMTAFEQAYGLKIPVFLDTQNRLIRKLGVKVTPEVVFADPNGKILYQGAIDNWYFGLGKHRTASTENYLNDAIEAWSRGEAPKISRTTAIGCIIER